MTQQLATRPTHSTQRLRRTLTKLRQQQRRMLFEQLEDRRLLSGQSAWTPGDLSARLDLATANYGLPSSAAQSAVSGQSVECVWSQQSALPLRRELVFVDATTPNYLQLVQDLTQNPDGTRQFAAFVIEPEADGVAAIGQVLSQYHDIDAVHIISHGRAGAVQLGRTELSTETLRASADQVRGWAGALTADADILFYGCDVARDVAGKQFVEQLSELTGADVAASTDVTGSRDHGGDWTLEFATGSIEAGVPFSSDAQDAWTGTLVSTSVFYLPLREEDALPTFNAINSAAVSPMFTATSIVVTADNSIIIFDHADDGYEANDLSVGQASTQIWGDNNSANGIPPGFTTDVLRAGDVITLEDTVPIPHPAGTIHWDGGDKIVSLGPLAIERTLYSTATGPLHAGAVEVFPVDQWGTSYRLPVGENITTPTLFQLTSPYIMAAQDGTVVSIDTNADGTPDTTVTLNQGEEWYAPVATTVNAGATITANKPIQVHLATGDIGSNYESDWFALVPINRWTNDYYTPVGTTNSSYPAVVFLYNPSATALTVNYQTQSGSGSVSVPAGGTSQYTLTGDTGARFYSSGQAFFALEGMGLNSTNDAAYDWGFPLIPAADLTSSVVVGWGPGVDPLNSQYGTLNGSPAWVTSPVATTVYIDLDGNPATGSLFDPYGNRYDQSVSLAALQPYRVYDTTDNDQTGVRLYTLDGNKLAVAWGEDPAVAGTAQPYLDIGTWVLPTPALIANKTAASVIDANGNGYTDAGDTVRFTITVRNVGVMPVSAPNVLDTLPTYTNYVPNSTTINSVQSVRDEFSTVSYANNDGTQNWTGSWTETGDNPNGSPSTGHALVSSGALRLNNNASNAGTLRVERELNLATATSATLGFNYALVGTTEAADQVVLEVSNNGGSTWTTVQTYAGPDAAGYGSFELSDYARTVRELSPPFPPCGRVPGIGRVLPSRQRAGGLPSRGPGRVGQRHPRHSVPAGRCRLDVAQDAPGRDNRRQLPGHHRSGDSVHGGQHSQHRHDHLDPRQRGRECDAESGCGQATVLQRPRPGLGSPRSRGDGRRHDLNLYAARGGRRSPRPCATNLPRWPTTTTTARRVGRRAGPRRTTMVRRARGISTSPRANCECVLTTSASPAA